MLLLSPGGGPVNECWLAMGIYAPGLAARPRRLFGRLSCRLSPLGVETLVFLGGLQNVPRDVWKRPNWTARARGTGSFG